MYILTDASFDDDSTAGLGGVVFNGEGSVVSWFTGMLSEDQVQKFIRGDAQVVIGESEALAPIWALDLWAHWCRIKGYSSSISLSLLSQMLAVRLGELVCIQWFARVASASNLADFPSRGEDHELLPCDIRCDASTTLCIFERCAEEFLVDQIEKLGLGQVANKTNANGSPSNARKSKRKLSHGYAIQL